MLRYIILLLAGAALAGCNNEQEDATASNQNAKYADKKLQQVSWLEGNWYMEYPTGVLTESWSKAADTAMAGRSALVNNNGDTMMSEHIKLVSDGSTLWYIPTIEDQNNGQPVRFKEAIFTDTFISFENPEHDYPQRIIYKKLSDSTIEARVEGSITNKTTQEVFLYKKKAN